MRLNGPILLFSLLLLVHGIAYSEQSTITEATGNACMGDDKSKKQTEQAALTDAKKSAVEFASTYITSETEVKNFQLQNDVLTAYANAEVKIIQEMEKSWYKDASYGDCHRVIIKAEIIPNEKAMENLAKNTQFADDPSAPLKVKVWTGKKEYKQGDKVKVYIKGNKPFFARVLHKDASGETLQLLPNPYRNENYFNGGVVYEIPSGNDKFDLEVSPPFGEENISVYASTLPFGDINIETKGAVYQVITPDKDIGTKTRGIKLTNKTGNNAPSMTAAEFVEDKVSIKSVRNESDSLEKAVLNADTEEDLKRGVSQRTEKAPIANKSNTPAKLLKNGWTHDGETPNQKRIVAAARAVALSSTVSGKSSGPSSIGRGHQTDIDDGDGTRMLDAIQRHNKWVRKSGSLTVEQIKKEMRKAFVGSNYEMKQVNDLVDRIVIVYNPKNIPSSEPAVLTYLGIRRQCHEWADYIGGKGETKQIKNIKDVRPGMGLFIPKPNEHAMIITDVLWKDDMPIKFQVAEANYGSGWVNPKGQKPWERTVRNDRIVDTTVGRVGSYE